MNVAKGKRKMASEAAGLRRPEGIPITQPEGIPDLEPNVEKRPACSICRNTGYTKANCKTRQHYFPLIRKEGMGNYKRYLLNDAPLCKSPVSNITRDVWSHFIESVQVLSVHAIIDTEER